MYSDKKITKEDTWKPADLRRHLREEGYGDDYVRRDETGRKHRGGESTERRHRDPEKESRRERDKHGERENTRERRHDDEKDRYVDRRKEGSRDRRGDKERDRREDREKRRERERLVDANKYYSNDSRENRDRRRDKEEKHERERDKERDRDKEKERVRDRERHNEEDRYKRREDRDKERRREERDKEHRTERERRRHEESGEGGRDRLEKHDREYRDRHRERDRHKDEYEITRNDKERRERHEDRKHSELKEERVYKEEHRKHKEDRERRHRERGYHDEKRKHDGDSREHRALKGSGEEVRHQRADGDKHKERRHRVDEDPESNHRDRTNSKKSSSDKSHETKTAKTQEVERLSEHWTASVKDAGDTEEPVINDENLADQEYEDDFEDYEEDFEEMDESANEGEEEEEEPEHPEVGEETEELTPQRREEIKAIRRAMDEENERIGTAQSRESTSREEEDRAKWSRGSEKNQNRISQRGKFIDFVAAKQREVSKKVATKQKKRSTELLRLIDLDFSMTFSLLDLPPVNEYDMYIRNFGTANTKQAYVQCNEDNADRDIQTEEIEVCEKWTQHPPEHNGACGDPNLSYEARDKSMSELNFDSQRLTAFLHSASQVMVVLLEEDQAERKSLRKLRTQTDTLSFSDGSLQLNTKLPFLYGRQISLVHFSQVQRHTMMSVHKPTTKPSAVRLDSCTLICIWNIWEPSRPQKILVYESEVQCCCFSPGKAILVFAGTSVGSVVLWDLREHASNHYRLKIGDEEWTFRQPTFSTDAVMAGFGHFSSVTSVEVVPSATAEGLRPEVLLLASEEESSGLSFQLASLDESGVLNFWVVVELPKTNEAGSQTDLGLRPGGKVKLLHSSSLFTAERVSPRDAVKTAKTGTLQTLHLKFLPTDSNHFFIGTNMGLVNHGTSHGLKAPPKFYSFQDVGVRPADVSSIHFSPFSQHFFLVGCGDGSIRLHAVSREQPVAEWKNGTAGEPVVSLQWAQTRPTVFCVLDAASNLHIWDLLTNDTEPVVTERMNADRVTAMAVFGDSGQQNTYSGIALAHESGKIEMQYFTRNFTVPSSAEEEKLERMMTEAF
ncbi:cytoplasmic dynein 2 intermediate chain 1 isoform X2 [Thunnus maccoyii]|uniref:cytoplasmic dynein 2 intermediate chain 1 isoform X2 n=1 Tax=Thunnus maccoyii TaxID=8240 RepID=UPI001C4BB0BB|nr:cytoplasmic dynein 2 intermediate chain 1 isoform X2 [Thunnus maccoyii]